MLTEEINKSTQVAEKYAYCKRSKDCTTSANRRDTNQREIATENISKLRCQLGES